MAFMLLEDMGRPAPKRIHATFGSIHIVRPVWRLIRYTIYGSRFLWRSAVWVLMGDRVARQPTIISASKEQTHAERTRQL